MERSAAAVVADADGHPGLVQEEGDDGQRSPSAGDVDERLAEAVAALQGLAGAVQRPEAVEVVRPGRSARLVIVGGDLFGGVFVEEVGDG